MLYEYNAIVTHVYDGDTITVDIDLGFGIWMRKQKIRLAHIDAWEIRGVERDKGLMAWDALRDWILNKKILLRTIKDKKEKYGRWLGVVILLDNGVEKNINERLVLEGHATKY